MNECSFGEIRIYAPAEKEEGVSDGYPQLTIHDSSWTENEREQMRIHGYDSMDMMRAWLG